MDEFIHSLDMTRTHWRKRPEDPEPAAFVNDKCLGAAAATWGSTMVAGATGAGLGAAMGGPVGAAVGAAMAMPIGAYLGGSNAIKRFE